MVNKHQQDHEIEVCYFVWHSSKHLMVAPGLSRKLFDRFMGPFHVLEHVGRVNLKLAIPPH